MIQNCFHLVVLGAVHVSLFYSLCVYVIFHVRKAWFLNIWESQNHGAWNPVERHGILKFPRGAITVLNILTLLSGDLSGERSLFGKQGLFAILSMKPPLIYLLSFGSPRERCHAPCSLWPVLHNSSPTTPSPSMSMWITSVHRCG